MGYYKRKKTVGDTEWFVHDRFGMFIHFGLYAMPATWEWYKTTDLISDEKYDKYFKHFNPDMFDAREWAKKAKAAGMKYAVLTTKHHEGFCLFDSEYTDYKITNTPFGRDLVREYVEAFRAEGLKVGFYYSLIDWHHPDFPIDVIHPLREHPNAEALDRGRDMEKYADYVYNQTRELLTGYGKIDILWFDFSYPNPSNEHIKEMLGFAPHAPANPPKPWMQYNGGKGKDEWKAERLIKMIRELMPDIVLNDRTGMPGDIGTPEQVQLTKLEQDGESGEYLPWEACHTFSGSWGYARDEYTWKSPKMLIDMLIKTVARGGNLIMNVGPTARGCFDKRADAALTVFADWMKYNSRAIYGATIAEPYLEEPKGAYLTQSEDGSRIYLCLTEYPFKTVTLKGLARKIDYAQFLSDASEVEYSENCDTGEVIFKLPVIPPTDITPVIEIFTR